MRGPISSGAGRAMHALLLAVAAVVFAAELTLVPGVVAAAAGAFAGSLLAERCAAVRLRLAASVAVGLGVAGLGWTLTEALLGSKGLATALGPPDLMAVGEVARWSTLALGAALALRAVALRFRAALAVEGALAVLVVASQVAAHRDGMIARPLEISDWFWAQGVDPVWAFLGVGLVGALLLAGVLAYGRSGWRTLAQLALVLLLGIGAAAVLHEEPLDGPRKNAVGAKLNKDKDGERDGPAGAGGAGSGEGDQGQDQSDLPPPPQQHGGRNRPTAVVVFHRDVQPFGDVFYFRHAAFSQFNGVRLVEATVRGLDPDARYDAVAAGDVPGAHRQGEGRAVVATDVAMLSDHSRTFALVDATRVEPMANPEPARFRRAYRVVSMVPTATVPIDRFLGLEPGDPGWSDADWRHYTELPRDGRYHDLARRLQSSLRAEFSRDPMALAFAVKQYLEQESIYSFQRRYEGDEPTGAFLFSEDKRGYCVHLAHAAAYLLRALGVPTRVSAGYAVPAQNLGRGSALLVKDGDAHAWAEIYLRGVGWLPIEVTPEQTDVEPAPFEEQDLQQLLGEMARKEGRFERAPRDPPKVLAYLKAALWTLPWVLLGLVIFAYAVKAWRLWRALTAADAAAVKAAYRGALDVLPAAGLVRQRGESRERFAMRAAEVAPAFAVLTRVHVGAALGARAPLAAAEGRPLSGWFADAARQALRSVPGWRVAAWALNPVSWMWSR